jgi:hypothetical protein
MTLLRTTALLALLGLCGCAEKPPADPHAAEIAAAMAKLSPEDRKVAEAQKVCPIGNSPLGSMGVPIKVDVDGKAVFICCEGCRTELLAKHEKSKVAPGDAKPEETVAPSY